MAPERSDRLLTVAEVMQRLAVSRKTVYKYIHCDLLKAKRLPSGQLRIEAGSLSACLRDLSQSR